MGCPTLIERARERTGPTLATTMNWTQALHLTCFDTWRGPCHKFTRSHSFCACLPGKPFQSPSLSSNCRQCEEHNPIAYETRRGAKYQSKWTALDSIITQCAVPLAPFLLPRVLYALPYSWISCSGRNHHPVPPYRGKCSLSPRNA